MLKHITIGLFIPYCALIILYFKNGFRISTKALVVFPWVFLFCMLWSIIPDIAGILPAGIGASIINHRFFGNAFFFHKMLENIPTLESLFGLSLMLVILFSVFIIFWRHLRQQEMQIRKIQRWR